VFASASAVYRVAKSYNPRVTLKNVKDFLATQHTFTLHKQTRRKYARNRVMAYGLDDCWHIDLADMNRVKTQNSNIRYCLVAVDVLSKYSWAQPCRTKEAKDVVKAFDKILKTDYRKPERVFSDRGRGKTLCQCEVLHI